MLFNMNWNLIAGYLLRRADSWMRSVPFLTRKDRAITSHLWGHFPSVDTDNPGTPFLTSKGLEL